MADATLGQRGEAAAARWYLKNGYRLLEHNYKTRFGELDLILQKKNQIIIAEVKTRSPSMWYRPMDAVHPAKQQRIILATQRYLQSNDLLDASIRFDVMEVIPREQGGFLVRCIPDAFQAG